MMLTIRERIRYLSRADRDLYEAAADRFDRSREPGAEGESDLAAFLPAGGPVRILALVYMARCEMEARSRRGEPCSAESYLVRFPELADDPVARQELLAWEYRLARAAGGPPADPEQRCPERAAASPGNGDLEALGPWAPPAEYEIDGEPLGRGAWGVVYRARHRRLGRFEALKVVDPRLGASRRGRALRARLERLRREIPIAARLNHPNIVHLYADGESNGHPYFVMEYCPGGTLAQRLARGPLSPSAAAELVETLARAAHAVHAFGLVHRDLKPSNVLFGAGDMPKIADFGLALPVSGGEVVAGEIAGTPAYMAPEQADPRAAVGPSADVWALGAILHECLTGRPSGVGGGVLPAGVPADLGAICRKCLQKEPGERYATAGDLADDLGRFRRGEPIFASPPGPCRRLGMWARRRPAVAALAAAVSAAGLVALVLAVLWLRSERDQRQAAERHRTRVAALLDGVVDAHLDMAVLLRESGQPGARFAPHYGRMAALLQQRIDDEPADARHWVNLGTTRFNLARATASSGKVEDILRAVALYTEAIAAHEKARWLQPPIPKLPLALRDAHWNRAAALARLGRYAEALPDWDRAVDLSTDGKRDEMRLNRALTIVHLGDHARAVTEAEEAVGPDPQEGLQLSRLAQIHALAAGAAATDVRLAAGAVRECADRYAARAVALMRAAFERKFYKNPTSWSKLQTDPVYRALWESAAREDFARLIADVKASLSGAG